MSGRKRKAPDSTEQACMLCRRAEADPNICGDKLQKEGLCAHEFCLLCANKLFQHGEQAVGLMRFLPEDIQHTVKQAVQKHCFVCGQSGATITCLQAGCKRHFHLPCAIEGSCITQFYFQYRSFCWEHRPQQAVKAAPEENTACLICQDPVEDTVSYGTMVCPACKHAWFHRACIQGQAVHDGISGFRCPLCRDRGAFVSEMFIMGIRIPFRLPSWDSLAYAALSERHSRCDARQCLCPGGREQAEEEGPWQLLLCCSCAAEGTHRRCSHLRNSIRRWECDSCAGLGSAPGASSEIARPSTASQPGSGPPHGSPAAPSSSPSSGSQAPLGMSSGSPELEGSSSSSSPGPDHTRHRSHSRRGAQTPYSRPRRCRRTRRAPSPSADPHPPPPSQ